MKEKDSASYNCCCFNIGKKIIEKVEQPAKFYCKNNKKLLKDIPLENLCSDRELEFTLVSRRSKSIIGSQGLSLSTLSQPELLSYDEVRSQSSEGIILDSGHRNFVKTINKAQTLMENGVNVSYQGNSIFQRPKN